MPESMLESCPSCCCRGWMEQRMRERVTHCGGRGWGDTERYKGFLDCILGGADKLEFFCGLSPSCALLSFVLLLLPLTLLPLVASVRVSWSHHSLIRGWTHALVWP